MSMAAGYMIKVVRHQRFMCPKNRVPVDATNNPGNVNFSDSACEKWQSMLSTTKKARNFYLLQFLRSRAFPPPKLGY